MRATKVMQSVTVWLAQARLRPLGYGAAAFACFATRGHGVACRAVACEASEGWWSQAGSNRRPRHCERRALPAELWPRRDRLKRDRGGHNRRHLQSAPRSSQERCKKVETAGFGVILPGTSLVCAGM